MFRLMMAIWLMLPTSLFGRPEAKPQAACAGVSCSYLPVVVYSPPIGFQKLVVTGTKALTLRMVGEVYNMTQSPVYDVTIAVRVYDDADQLIGTKTGKTELYATLPGQLNPFDIPTDFSSYYRMETVITGWLTTSVQTYRSVPITIDHIDYNNVTATISGKVHNDLATPLIDVHYVAWTLKQEESIVGTHLADMLLPGQTITYTRDIQVWGLYAPPISVAAQGVVSPTLALNQSTY